MMPGTAVAPRSKASEVDRLVSGLIDGLILMPVGLLMIIPIVGWIAYGLIAAAWWLLRDSQGISIGKKVMNLEVISKDGGTPTRDQLMKRNFTLAGPMIIFAIPLVGPLIGGPLCGLVFLIEGILVLSKGERYGDTMANTMVVKKG